MYYRGTWKGDKPHGKGCIIAGGGPDIGISQGWMNMGDITGLAMNIKPNGNKCTTNFTDNKKNGTETEWEFTGGEPVTREFDMVDL